MSTTPFPGLTTQVRSSLWRHLRPWRGDVDPDRDLWECQKSHPEIRIEGAYLITQSEPAQIHFAGRDYDFGRFEVQINLLGFESNNEFVRLISPGSEDHYSHPHISAEYPCLGKADVPLHKAAYEGRWDDVLDIVNRFLCSYDPKEAYRNIKEWAEDDESCIFCPCQDRFFENMCRPCFEENEETCFCPNCSQPQWDCNVYEIKGREGRYCDRCGIPVERCLRCGSIFEADKGIRTQRPGVFAMVCSEECAQSLQRKT